MDGRRGAQRGMSKGILRTQTPPMSNRRAFGRYAMLGRIESKCQDPYEPFKEALEVSRPAQAPPGFSTTITVGVWGNRSPKIAEVDQFEQHHELGTDRDDIGRKIGLHCI